MHTHLQGVQTLGSFVGMFSSHREMQTDHLLLLPTPQSPVSTVPSLLDHFHILMIIIIIHV